MRLFLPAVAALILSAASFAVTASVTEADMFGNAAQPSAARRTVSIDPKTRWVTVERGEVVRFVANGQEFAWAFNGMSSSFALNRIAPSRALDRDLKVYIWPNAEDLSNN
jgi:Heavy-metal resistance protein CzcE